MYVIAISAITHGLYHLLVEHQVFFGIESFIFVFFTIWWSWMNYTWFSSAYDNDDVIFRILTFFQIFWLLVFTAGIASTMTENPNFAPGFIGFIIMHVVMILQWLRAAKWDPKNRRTCLIYAGGLILALIVRVVIAIISVIAVKCGLELIYAVFLILLGIIIYVLSHTY